MRFAAVCVRDWSPHGENAELLTCGGHDRGAQRHASSRARIVEVGHLAANRGGESRRLIQLLAPRLAAEGFDWVVGTVTQELRTMLFDAVDLEHVLRQVDANIVIFMVDALSVQAVDDTATLAGSLN